MKKVFLLLLVSLFVVTSCSKDPDVLPEKKDKSKGKLEKFIEKSEEGTITTTFTYGENGFVKEQEMNYAVNLGTEDEINEKMKLIYFYNSNDYVEKIEVFVKDVHTGTLTYVYSADGKVKKVVHKEEGKEYPITTVLYKYNEKGWVIEEKEEEMEDSASTPEITITNYEHDTKGNIIKRSGNRRSTQVYTYDDKKNPVYNMFPDNFPNVSNGESLVLQFSKNKNNITSKGWEGETPRTFIYTYDDRGYPISGKVKDMKDSPTQTLFYKK